TLLGVRRARGPGRGWNRASGSGNVAPHRVSSSLAPRRLPMAEAPDAAPLRSVHSTTFPELLQQLGISVAVTTYQAGKLVLLRADQGKLNTHFRGFRRPMGLAVTRGRLAVGTATEVWDFHDVPAVASRLEPPGKHDACFLPRSAHFTGDILV